MDAILSSYSSEVILNSLERITFNHSVSRSNILCPNGPGDATVKLDTV